MGRMEPDSAAVAVEAVAAAHAERAPLLGLLPPALLPMALAGGLIASNELSGAPEALLAAAIAAILAGAWWILWRALTGAAWRATLTSLPGWTSGDPAPALPYTLPGSGSARASAALGRARHWARHVLIPAHGVALFAIALTIPGALVLAAALGAQTVVLTCILTLSALGVAASHRAGGTAPGLAAQLALVALPFLLGHAALRPLPIGPAGVITLACALGLALACGKNRVAQNIGYGALILTLLTARHTVGAYVIAMLWLPLALLPGFKSSRGWLAVTILTAAIALA